MHVKEKGSVELKLRTLPHGALSTYWLTSWRVGRDSGNATPSGASEMKLTWCLQLEDPSESPIPKSRRLWLL